MGAHMPSTPLCPNPGADQAYNDSLKRIKILQSHETNGFNPSLKTILLTQGKRTKKAVLWFHGYTAATLQFKPLAELCFKKGYNVLVPCIPHHGMKDRMTNEVSKIRMKELVQFTNYMVDVMHGLGDKIVVGGLSMGGVMSSWVAQYRPDVATSIIIAPFLGARIIPTKLIPLVVFATGLLPDIRQWWDPEKKMECDGPKYGYPQYSYKSLRQVLKMGMKIRADARKRKPTAKKVYMVINDHDESVNNELCQQLVDNWEGMRATNVQTHHFPDALGIPHDCISIEEPQGKTNLVYSVLMKIVEGKEVK
jgi:carboxylesterase